MVYESVSETIQVLVLLSRDEYPRKHYGIGMS